MNKTLSFLLCLCFLLDTTVTMSQTYKTESSIPYRQSSPDEYTTHQCVLDIYYPIDSSNFATVVWFHGGGLTGGDKEIPQELQNQGICIVGVRYRLCTDDRSAINADVKTSDCIDDAAAAAAWVMKNIEKYGGDRNRIFLAGHSAGGYLVSMIGFDKSRLAKYGVDADDFAALIPYSGQMITHFHNRKQRGISELQPLIDSEAPLYHIRKDCPPILLICGDRERELLGRYEENAYCWRMLKLVGHPEVHLYELDGFDHGSMARPAHFIALEYIKNASR